jgi:protein-L-isoaspartate(D-aspartate) O-methyltransferase
MTDFAALRQRMVDNQIRPSEVTDHEVIKAFLAVPREDFVAPAERPFAYTDHDLRLPASAGTRRQMLQPVQLARMVQTLPHGPERTILVVGGGTGYSAAILARLVGRVVALEEDPALATFAETALAGLGNVTLARGPLAAGLPGAGPYDGILIEGALEVLPRALVEQLKPGGLMLAIEQGERISRAMLYERVGNDVTNWPQFEAWAPVLPGFARVPEFVF